MNTIFTIGGYGHSQEGFFEQLHRHQIDVLVDIRQRRGMRGKIYGFLNANALQSALQTHQIAYTHLKTLAPTSCIRDAQKSIDKESSTLKKERTQLSATFTTLYHEHLATHTTPEEVIQILNKYKNPCFFCVENEPSACHRSLAAGWLKDYADTPVLHIGVR